MGKKKAEAKKERGSGQSGLVEIDPAEVYFTHSRVRPQFSCGRRVEETLKDLEEGTIKWDDMPPVTFIASMTPCGLGPPYFSLNNRRLFCLKRLREKGIITTVNARVKPPVDSKRERERYTPEKCSLTARLMGIKKEQDGDADGADDGASDADEAEAEESAAAKPVPKLPFPHSWKKDCYDSTVYAVDINSLQPRKWVRDPVISFFFDLLGATGGDEGVKFISPAVAMLLKHGDRAAAEGVVADMGLKSCRKLFVAVNDSDQECPVSGSHWSLLYFDREAAAWRTADSMAGANAPHAAALAEILHPHTAPESPLKLEEHAEQAQQKTSHDCGLHLLLHTAQVFGAADRFPSTASEMRVFVKEAIYRFE